MVEITNAETANALVQALSDDYSRKIMLATIMNSKSVEDLSKENDIPLSTCYRRVHELLDTRVLVVERIVVTPDGKRYEMLRSAYRAITVNFEGGTMKVEATVNEDVADKLRRMWVTMKQ